MAKSKKQKQVHQYDKVFQENIDAATPGLVKNVLKINAVHTEELPDNIQHTKEGEPDFLKKVIDDKGNTFILHLEFQLANDPNMAYRMAENLIMASRKHQLPVRQYVIYIGESGHSMNGRLELGKSVFYYNLVELSAIDYQVFLRSKVPEEKMLAILAHFGNENPKVVIGKIAKGVMMDANGEFERLKRKKQFRILAQLRNLVSQNIEVMEHVTSFFKEENDIFYKVGEKRGMEKGIEEGRETTSFLFVKKLLQAKRFTIAEIANFASVTDAYVRKIKKSIEK